MQKLIFFVTVVIFLFPFINVKAQDPVTLIVKEAIVKAIRAADLRIQRLQNETIWLQNAQKTAENAMAKLRLQEIADWVEKQRELYAEYFEELRHVKTVLTYYHKVSAITELERALLHDYNRLWKAVRNDPNLSQREVEHIGKLCTGVLVQSKQQLDGLFLVIESLVTQMSDAARMKIIDGIAQKLQEHYDNLKRLSVQSRQLSIARAKEAKNIALIKALYGL